MGFLERKREYSRQPTRAEKAAAHELGAEMSALAAEQARLMNVGLQGEATIVSIQENVAESSGIPWHEVFLDVELPDRDPYRASRRVMAELSTMPWIRPGERVPVRVDPEDRAKVLITRSP